MSDASVPWRLDYTVFARPDDRPDVLWLWARLSEATSKIRSHVGQGGLTLGDADGQAALFAAAAGAIDEVLTLAEIVRARVRHVYVLKAPPGYDISHSEPYWTDRIFISIPERSDRVGALRLAENVIHEAMHLHLTSSEHNRPLVRDLIGRIHSPWRQTPRPYGGVLHGLFVFACLREYFARLPADGEPAGVRHIRRRLQEIDAEIAHIDIDRLAVGLTDAGQALAVHLLARHSPPSKME
jgi:HEXXH motif-containing protein